jgi:hypothetical protein
MRKWRWTRRGRSANVTDNTRTGRTAETDLSSRAAWRLLTRRRRVYILLIETLLILGVALIGHITGRELARRQLLQREQTIVQLREERQQVSAELNRRADRILTLQTRLNHVQGVLDEIVPSEDIYVMRPNQSLVVAGGRVTVGLVGSPTIQGVNINVNGKQQLVNAGDIVRVNLDETRTCQVTVQSFDMFKVVLHATCATDTK